MFLPAAPVAHLAGAGLLRRAVEKVLRPGLSQGICIGEVDLNLLSGLLPVEDFQLRNGGRLRMRFGRLHLAVSPWRLLTGELYVERARLGSGYLPVDRCNEGGFDLGLPPPADAGADPGAEAALRLSLAQAALEGVTIEYHDGDLVSTVYIENIEVGAYSSRLASQRVPLSWRLQWEGRAIAGDATVNLEQGQLAADGRFATGLLDLGRA